MRGIAQLAMSSLQGKTIALTEARRAMELATLVTKLGGTAYSVPAVREVPRKDRKPALEVLDRLVRGEIAVTIFMTGVGTRALVALAAETGRRETVLAALARTLIVARGPKPVAALREAGLQPAVVPAEPTSDGVLEAVRVHDLRGRAVAVQLSGDESRGLLDGLRALGADVLEIPLYEWALPEDVASLERLVHDLIAGRIDVVAFTSSPQVRHLFLIADRLGVAAALATALRERVVTAVIGPVCRASLAERGITPAVEAEKGTMGALAHAIARHVSTA
ncbi:MAG: uroporphyrinogen-III synthase [Candidatus Rokubacteria bacterium]|nr:uroporphyrinogen-III synthase [Candidatus Rokubacteria bacterium]